MTRLVADVGNSRVKWGRLADDGAIVATGALAFDDPSAWSAAEGAWGPIRSGSSCAISSVNPNGLDRFVSFLRRLGDPTIRLFRSAADVPVPHALATPGTTGADRALAVFAALDLHGGRGPGQVISCGTAVTVERISDEGVWQGGAIAPGMGPIARALRYATAQLPLIALTDPPPGAWGNATEPALNAGIYWSLVGAIREILTRQAEGLSRPAWRIWTGGDAPVLAPHVVGPSCLIRTDLVLEGLARVAFRG